jgi:hypothetical protein
VTAFRSTQKRTCFTVGCDFVQTRKKARWRGRLRSISRPASRFASAGRRAGISICTASGGRRLGTCAWASCGAGGSASTVANHDEEPSRRIFRERNVSM